MSNKLIISFEEYLDTVEKLAAIKKVDINAIKLGCMDSNKFYSF